MNIVVSQKWMSVLFFVFFSCICKGGSPNPLADFFRQVKWGRSLSPDYNPHAESAAISSLSNEE